MRDREMKPPSMLSPPFLLLAIVLILTSLTLVFMPLGVMFGYPFLLVIGIIFLAKWSLGRLPCASSTAAVWLTYLGIVVCLHGVILSTDTALAGAPLSMAELQFGKTVAKSGGALACGAAIAAILLDRRWRRRIIQNKL